MIERPKRALIVEDDDATLELATRVLRRLGLEVCPAKSNAESILALQSETFVIVLLDHKLPDGESWPVLDAALNAPDRTPVIVVTAMGDERVAAEAIHRGAMDYVVKSGDFWERLRLSIVRTIKHSSSEREQAHLAAVVECSPHAIVSTTADGFVRSWNTAATTLFGYSAEAALGANLSALPEIGIARDFPALLARLQRGETISDLEIPRTRMDGSQATLSYTLSPLIGASGQTLGLALMCGDVSQRKEAERAGRESEARYQTIFSRAPDGLAIVNQQHYFIDVNDSLALMLGYTREELIGEPASKIVGPTEIDHMGSAVRAIQSQTDYHREWPLQCKNGLPLQVEVMATLMPDGSLMTMIRDITARKRAEASSSHLAAIVTSSDDAIIGKDLNGNITSWNKGAEKVFGWSAAEMVGTSIVRLIPSDRQDEEIQILKTMSEGRSVGQFETRRLTRDGRQIDVSVTLSPVKDVHGKVFGISKVARDITERKRAETALRESEHRHRSLFENMLNGYAYCEMLFDHGAPCDFRYLAVNPAFEALTGLKNVVGKLVTEVIPGIRQCDPEIFETYGRVVKTGVPEILETYVNSMRMWFSISVYRTAPGHFVNTFDVITERKLAENSLRESEERFRQLAENINEVFWIASPGAGEVQYVSPAYEKIWGRTCADLYQSRRAWLDSIHPDDREQVRAALTKQESGGYDETYRILRPSGSVRWIHDRAYPLRDAAGDVFRVVGTASDITGQRNMEAQFRQSQKMEAFGLLAGGVAHDFNNLLSVVIGYCDLWLIRLPPDAPIIPHLTAIKNAGERAAALTKQLLAFSRQTVMEPKVLDLNVVVRETEKMLARLIGDDVRLTSILDPGIPRVKVDPAQIGQVLINLAVNGRDAMLHGGDLTIRTGTVTLDAAYVSKHAGAHPGVHAMLSISDTGCGMTPAVMARIFEPFFTTKEPGKGTGLGLAVVHGVVTQSGGSLEIASQVGIGTTFKLFSP